MDTIPVKRQWELLAKNDYAFYCEYTHHGNYKVAKHHQLICNALERIPFHDNSGERIEQSLKNSDAIFSGSNLRKTIIKRQTFRSQEIQGAHYSAD
jgi:hypothetical protein